MLVRILSIVFLSLAIATACAPSPAATPPTNAPSAPSTRPAQAPTLAPTTPAQATTAAPSSSSSSSAQGPTAAPTGTAGAMSVDVKLSEFRVDMPTKLSAGTVTFHVTNAGTIIHSFEIQGQGLTKTLDTSLNPGQSATLQVDLKPGTYQAFCPIDGHKDQGMLATLTVGQ